MRKLFFKYLCNLSVDYTYTKNQSRQKLDIYATFMHGKMKMKGELSKTLKLEALMGKIKAELQRILLHWASKLVMT